ncbi:putative methanogenesis marker protein 7 [Methanococcus voltae]|uniref:methanogenesis marker 7 protein n=1 Tax=Methanococcus voltae TaxID=2188 RepID=UPI001AE4C38F|nr:methanogenesis marker 7 protein [Methanococcus voltae]MBP2143714.1 putative methanogenesis marker protein 7 [Methanococcus voltae]
MYQIVRYEGGVYKHNELKEWIEDVGGFIIQEHVMQLDVFMTVAFPEDEIAEFKNLSKNYKGKVVETPLAGIEIAVVAPSLSRHHLPHIACDVSEYVRKFGAKPNMIGLSHGAGKSISQIKEKEKRLIEEHDLAIYVMGNFKSCIEDKIHLFDVDIPVIVTGGPEHIEVGKTYIGNLGRRSQRLRRGSEIKALDNMIENITEKIGEKRLELSYDPPIIPPVVLKDEIEKNIADVHGIFAPMPIVTQLDGLRIKLDYDRSHERIENLKIDNYVLKDIAYISKSLIKNYILVKLKSKSEVLEESENNI